MQRIGQSAASILSGCLAALLVLLSTTLAAQQFKNSELYSKSRLISLIFAQDSVGILNLAGNKDNVDMMLKFVGALTSAYINFELIPIGEVQTFAAVFESVQGEVKVDRFEYRRKNLIIYGWADTEEQYRNFLQHLEDTGQFENVSGHSYTDTDDRIRFEAECSSRVPESGYLDFG